MAASGFAQAGSTAVMDRLASFGEVRGAAFGAYGEWSIDVDHLLRAAAEHYATTHWRRLGMRSMEDLRAITIARYRRRLGMRAVQCMARHRLERVHMVGLSRASIESLRARDRREATHHRPPAALAPGAQPHVADVMQGGRPRADGIPRFGA